jgi:hypothetical protein
VQQTPRRTRANDLAQSVEHIEQFLATLKRVPVRQGQVRSDEVPFFVRYIRCVRSALFHPGRVSGLATMYITRSKSNLPEYEDCQQRSDWRLTFMLH